MRRTDPAQLAKVAGLLRPLLDELVFVGGAVTSLLVTDAGVGPPRTTLDVDAIAEITSYAEYAKFGERLRALGFSEDIRESPRLFEPLVSRRYGNSDQTRYPERHRNAGADGPIFSRHQN
jgi:hypothetical protein